MKATAGATDEAPEPEKKQSKGAIHFVKKRSSSLKKMLSSSKIETTRAELSEPAGAPNAALRHPPKCMRILVKEA